MALQDNGLKTGLKIKTYTNIIFDLDGTLVDSVEGVTGSVRYALDKFGIKTGETELKSFIGPPLQCSFRERYGFNEEEVRQAIEWFRSDYREKGVYESSLYPFVQEMLDKLDRSGKRVFLATSKATCFAEIILCHLKIDHYFADVSGATLDGKRVEKKDVLAHLFEQNSFIDQSKTAMVGDREHDIVGARAFGLDSFAVTYGYGSEEELRQACPSYYAHSVLALTEMLLNSGL